MKLKEGHIPLYFQFYLILKSEIMLGEIEPGSRVPNIEVLHAHYGVSHATVRKAMALLAEEGLIVKKRGMGTLIRDEVDVAMWIPENSRENLLHSLTAMKPRTLSQNWVIPPRRIKKLFQDQPAAFKNGFIFFLLRVWESPGKPWHRRVSQVYLPADLAAEYGEEQLADSYIVIEVLKRRRYGTLKITTTLRPWLCDVESAGLLGLPDGTPLFHRSIVVRNPQNRIILVSEWLATTTSFVREIEIPVGDVEGF
jgi:GntR family transcriptional regulator